MAALIASSVSVIPIHARADKAIPIHQRPLNNPKIEVFAAATYLAGFDITGVKVSGKELKKLAQLKMSADKPNNGYGEVSSDGRVLGRYRLGPKALIDAGWKNDDGLWTEKAKEAGVTTNAQFLKNPDAQEQALTDLLQRYNEELKARGAYGKIGTTMQDSHGRPLLVTESGLLAAAHKEGATSLAEYLDPNERSALTAQQIAKIEHRLRDAAGIPYDAAANAAEANTSPQGANAQKK
jgi:hypothetical protein